MPRLYLGLNAVIQLILGLWCSLDVDGTARAKGKSPASPDEYVVVHRRCQIL